MKLGVFSDMHGNALALRACLDQAASLGVTHFAFLGDTIADCGEPTEVLDLLYSLQKEAPCWILRGNREEYMLSQKEGTGVPWRPGSSSGSLFYTYHQLRPQDFQFFGQLPLTDVIRLGQCAPLRICHGSPEQTRAMLVPGSAESSGWAACLEERYLLGGHCHQLLDFAVGRTRFLNYGSCGLPVWHSPKVSFGMLEPDGREWVSTPVAVSYPIEQAVAKLVESGLAAVGGFWTAAVGKQLRTGANEALFLLQQVEDLGKGFSGERPESLWAQAAKVRNIPPLQGEQQVLADQNGFI